MVYPRQIFPTLEQELDQREATVITGMRRVGKTTALTHLYNLVPSPNKVIFDLENPLHRRVFETDNYDAIWNNLRQFGLSNDTKAYLFIDEVQNLPEISRVVKYLYDHWDVKFVLTGSSSYYLRNLFPESLAGRKMVFEMFPLTFAEFLLFKQVDRNVAVTFAEKAADKNQVRYELISPHFQEYLEFGGFPSVVLEPSTDRKRQLLAEVFTSYFEKDAKNLADFADMSKLRDLILLLVPRIGSRIEINKFASDLSISRSTVYSYLTFLDQTYFLSLLPRHSGSIDRQAAGSRKLFLCDTGMATYLGRVSQGQLLEQYVFQTLRGGHNLSFHNVRGNDEIDFVVDKQVALEVKMSASQRDIAKLHTRANSVGIDEHYVITEAYSDEPAMIPACDL